MGPLSFRIWGPLGFRVWGPLGFKVWGPLGFKVWGPLGFKVWGPLGFKVWGPLGLAFGDLWVSRSCKGLGFNVSVDLMINVLYRDRDDFSYYPSARFRLLGF